MGDDERAELAELRRRAYGPDDDIAGDAVALARLRELEAAARPRVAPPADDPQEPEVAPMAARTGLVPTPADPVPEPRRRTRHPSWHTAVVACVAVVALALALPASMRPAPVQVGAPVDEAFMPSGEMLAEVPLDRSAGRYVAPVPEPVFPVAEDLLWTVIVGTYYGWDVWFARSRSGQACIVIDREDDSWGQCVPQELFLEGTLHVSVPYGKVPTDLRPDGMTTGHRVGFWWVPERGLAVVLEDPPVSYFGGG